MLVPRLVELEYHSAALQPKMGQMMERELPL